MYPSHSHRHIQMTRPAITSSTGEVRQQVQLSEPHKSLRVHDEHDESDVGPSAPTRVLKDLLSALIHMMKQRISDWLRRLRYHGPSLPCHFPSIGLRSLRPLVKNPTCFDDMPALWHREVYISIPSRKLERCMYPCTPWSHESSDASELEETVPTCSSMLLSYCSHLTFNASDGEGRIQCVSTIAPKQGSFRP